MKIPMNLEHKPIFTVEDYNQIDGYRDENTTDAMGLSIGIAQWSDRHNLEISAKVWRHTGEKWSRQSEELPIHRVLDLSILICSVLSSLKSGNVKSSINIQGKTLPIELVQDKYSAQDLKVLEEFLNEHSELLNDRLRVLSMKLKDLNY